MGHITFGKERLQLGRPSEYGSVASKLEVRGWELQLRLKQQRRKEIIILKSFLTPDEQDFFSNRWSRLKEVEDLHVCKCYPLFILFSVLSRASSN